MTTALTRTALVTLLAALVWAALVVAGRPPAVVPDPGSSAAVAALTSRSAETAAGTVPTDFVADLGYVPRLEGQRLVNPTGSCSSPVPLPAEFEGPCRQHDLGYDLLRHAAHKGGALPTAARQHLDAQLVDSARASCAVRQGISRGWCSAWADIAGFFVRVNSVRQHDSAPLPEDAVSRAAMGVGALTLVGGTGTLALGGVRLRRSGAAQRVRRRLATLPVPRVSGAAAAVTGLALSISPSHLAHGPVLQGGLTAVCVGASVLVGHALRPHVPLLLGRARVWALTGVAAGAVGTLAWGQPALSARRLAIGMPPTDVTWWATVAAVVGAAWLVVRSLRWGWSRRRTAWRPTVVVSIASTVVFSGGPVHGAVTAPEDRVLLQSSPVGAVRAYAEMREGEVAGERAERAADELELAGGWRGSTSSSRSRRARGGSTPRSWRGWRSASGRRWPRWRCSTTTPRAGSPTSSAGTRPWVRRVSSSTRSPIAWGSCRRTDAPRSTCTGRASGRPLGRRSSVGPARAGPVRSARCCGRARPAATGRDCLARSRSRTSTTPWCTPRPVTCCCHPATAGRGYRS